MPGMAFADRIAAVFYDFHKPDDRWYYPLRLRGHGLFRSSNGSGPDFRIGFAHLLTPKFEVPESGWHGHFGWFAATALTILFYRKVIENNNLRIVTRVKNGPGWYPAAQNEVPCSDDG